MKSYEYKLGGCTLGDNKVTSLTRDYGFPLTNKNLMWMRTDCGWGHWKSRKVITMTKNHTLKRLTWKR